MNRKSNVFSVIAIVVIVLFIVIGIYFILKDLNKEEVNIEFVSKTYVVDIKNFKFIPNNITIRSGDFITWQNFDNAAHWLVLDNGTGFDSGKILNYQNYTQIFVTKGDYYYHCKYNPFMKAKISVQ